jgi:hypothetical protein
MYDVARNRFTIELLPVVEMVLGCYESQGGISITTLLFSNNTNRMHCCFYDSAFIICCIFKIVH